MGVLLASRIVRRSFGIRHSLGREERRPQFSQCGKGWEIMFGGEGDDEYRFSGMKWADNCWTFSDDREKLKCVVNDILDELMILDMELKPDSLWWTSPHNAADGLTLEMGGGGESWDMPFAEVFYMLGSVGFEGMGDACRGLRRR